MVSILETCVHPLDDFSITTSIVRPLWCLPSSCRPMMESTDDQFNDWGGRGCNKFVPVLIGNGTKIASTGDIFDQPPGEM